MTFEEVVENTDEYIGRQVTVSAEVDEVVVPQGAFSLGGEVEAQELIALPTQSAQVPEDAIGESTVVRVQGSVTRVDQDLGEEEDLVYEMNEDELLADYDGVPAIVASQIEVVDSAE